MNVLITLTEEEAIHAYLAVCRAQKGNTNSDAVNVFKDIQRKLDPHVPEGTKMAGSMMTMI